MRISHRLILSIWLALGVLLCAHSQVAWSQLRIDQDLNGLDISPHTSFLMETDGFDKTVIYTGQVDSQFARINTSNFGFSKMPIWLLLPVQNQTASEHTWVLSFPYALLDRVELYFIDANHQLQTQLSGDGIPGSQRIRSNRDISFLLVEPAHSQRRYYVRIASESSLQINPYAYSFDAYEKETVYETMFYSLFFGSFIAMGLYNLAMAFSTRSLQFLYYSLLVLLSVIREAYLAGMAYQMLWPESPRFNEYVGIYSMSVSIGLANIFIVSFLSLRKKSPTYYWLLNAGTGLAMLYMVAQPFVGYSVVIRPLSLQVLINSIIIIVASAVQLKRGNHAARFLILAWIFALGGWMVTAVAAYGVIPYSILTKYANPLGQFFEIIFLSFALADSINILRIEKNSAIIALNKGLAKEVKEKTQDIQSILDSIPLGILKIDGQSCIKKGHSRFIETLIQSSLDQPGTPIVLNGRSLHDIMLSRSDLSSDDVAVTRNVISASIHDTELQWLLNVGLLPTEITFHGRIFELLWTPIYSDTEALIQEVLLVIKDLTDLRKTEWESEQKRKENQIILSIIKTREKDFVSFMRTAQTSLATIGKIFLKDENLWLQDDVNEAWRLLHTLKGISRGLGFRDMSARIHDVETQLRGGGSRITALRQMLDDLVDELTEYRRIDMDVLKRSSDLYLEVSLVEMSQQVAYLENLLVAGTIRAADLKPHINQLKSFYRDTLSRIAVHQLQNLEKIAEGLGKPLPRLQVEDQAYYFDEATRNVVETVLIHLIRNSLDHGIERPAEREQAGKASVGVITMALDEKARYLKISYRDDGRGLPMDTIRSRALIMGLLAPDESPTPVAVASFIFYPHFSTTEKVTEISGRGVGMNAVREAIRKTGGSIEIVLDESGSGLDTQHQGFCLEIHLPKVEQPQSTLPRTA
ncbi:MAG TPA: 7TM diverse intracellular signaling domain-containing protein [Oligoflexus sp.]|uniref:7TM diverse intracellular signaling domain-containing protein n=1 Tax=Oligoflexus sp. TaxID=1971216 RepID=UPI002D233F33|nr:7TM diverse intracellular signaling domain-containing protein [Oligoflexus sp.]HYX35105.1 7TM diverse intracellular signaling domain-containing protein [Oligoflexus sp.]